MSQSHIKRKPFKFFETVPFTGESRTERGEKVYAECEITLKPAFGMPITRVLKCDSGVGITEEWVEDTIMGIMEALDKDYPNDAFEVVRLAPNRIAFEYKGTKGLVQ